VKQPHGMTTKVVELYYESLDCPRSLACWLMFSNNEHRQLVELEFNPDQYIDPQGFRDAYLATKFLSKADFLSTKIDLKAVALDKFKVAEKECGAINRRGFHHHTVNSAVGAKLHVAIQQKIESILVRFVPDELVDSSDWGPGVTLSIKGVDTSPVNKFRCENGTTRPLDALMGDLYAVAYPTWDLSTRQIQEGNEVITVPKNSKTDRTIAVEPGLNLWFQKGIGQMIRRRLRWVGVDLDSQKRNQDLSREGSVTGELATVDFSAASDTISDSVVRELLPSGWYDVMDITRSKFGVLKKHQFLYEKFSSMGNGFTFELESLIFFAIAHACCVHLRVPTEKVSVYGDDVIIPVDAYQLFVDTCKFYGFTVNTQKSYNSGMFRESCGAHWFNGLSCKPFFLKELIIGESKTYLAANNIRRVSKLQGFTACDARFVSVWRFLRRQVKKACLISEGYGDGGFVVNFDEANPVIAGHGVEGYITRFLADIPVAYHSDDHAVLLARLKARSKELSLGNKTPLRRRVKQKVKKLLSDGGKT